MPRLKGVAFETAIIERYRRRGSSVEEALIEMYLTGVSVRRVEDITEALWGSKVTPATISELNKKAYVHIEDWRNRPLQGGRYLYAYVDGIEETLTYCDFPSKHWTRIRTNNVIERLNREIRRRTRVVGTFPDGNSALMLVCARLRHVTGTQWGNKKYMNMKHLEAITGRRLHCRLPSFNRSLQTILRINLDGAREAAYHPRPHESSAQTQPKIYIRA